MNTILLFLLKRFRNKHFPQDDKVAEVGSVGRSLDDTIELIKLV